jgi:hypothetical protein
MMHGRKKSDSVIVAGKPTKKAATVAAEPVEPRTGAKGNASQQSTHRTQSRKTRVTRAGAHTARSPSHTQGGSRVRNVALAFMWRPTPSAPSSAANRALNAT